MSATILTEPAIISGAENLPNAVKVEVESVKCDCCGLTEECTPDYICRVKERFHGTWICGLCSEAVKDEIYRSERLIGLEEALNRHMNFCKKFRSSSPKNSSERLITAVSQILRRSLDSPRALRSTPNSPSRESTGVARPSLTRSGSCLPTLAG